MRPTITRLVLALAAVCFFDCAAFAEEPYPWVLLKDRKFRDAYYAMLGKKRSESWLSTLSGPSSPAEKINITGDSYLLLHSCKPHDCGDYHILIIYSPALDRAYAKLGEKGAISTLGNPSPEISAALDELYKDEFGADG